MRIEKKTESKIDLSDVKQAISEAGGEIWFYPSKVESILLRVKIGGRQVRILMEPQLPNLTALDEDENAPIHRVKSLGNLSKFLKKFRP